MQTHQQPTITPHLSLSSTDLNHSSDIMSQFIHDFDVRSRMIGISSNHCLITVLDLLHDIWLGNPGEGVVQKIACLMLLPNFCILKYFCREPNRKRRNLTSQVYLQTAPSSSGSDPDQNVSLGV